MEIPDFYRGRSVLVTGATGFIGKALVEKLLRCCPDIECVFVLVRAKRGASPQQRLAKMLALPVSTEQQHCEAKSLILARTGSECRA